MKYYPSRVQLSQFLIQIEAMMQLSEKEHSIMFTQMFWIRDESGDRVLIKKPDSGYLVLYTDINNIMHLEHESEDYLIQPNVTVLRNLTVKDLIGPGN